MVTCVASVEGGTSAIPAEGSGSIPTATLFEFDDVHALTGPELSDCKRIIEMNHYTRSIPSGKSHWFLIRGVIVCFSIPANKNIGGFLLKRKCVCWELARLWAKDGHPRNAMTQAIRLASEAMKRIEPAVEVLVSFADPNVGHEGFVYRAASWIYAGRSEESRAYQKDGRIYPRRSFHSGSGHGMTKAEIENRGFQQVKRLGKIRFAKGMTAAARRELRKIWK